MNYLSLPGTMGLALDECLCQQGEDLVHVEVDILEVKQLDLILLLRCPKQKE